MTKKIIITLIGIIVWPGCVLFGQDALLHPTKIQQAVYFDISPPIRDVQPILTLKMETSDQEVPNKAGKRKALPLTTNSFMPYEDPVWQQQDGTYLPNNAAPIQNFDGINNISGVYPPDTQGDVSGDKYVQVVNLKFAVYSKSGTLLLGPLDLKTIWAGIPAPWNGTNNGDPVVLYDQAADRWMITQFSLPNSSQYAELVAVSATSDPTGAWYRYVFQFGNKMPDYPKFGIWPDGYYMSVNQFITGSSWGGVGVCAFDRTKMIAGDPTASMIYFDLGPMGTSWSMLPADWDGTTAPVTGEPNYFSYYDDWTSYTSRFLKICEFHADWTTPTNSTFGQVASLPTAPFTSDLCPATRGRCINQPVTSVKLEALSDRLMYRLQYRNFGTHRSMVTNHTVNVDGNGLAGIRWYEMRNTGAGWNIYQQGTYSPNASHRWVGSIAMNSVGDMALGYTVSDATSTYPGIRYTGRKASDELGKMTFPEQLIISGSGYQTGSAARWGDYSMMSVDPSDDLTFWFTTEYLQTIGNAPWRTRIASFLFPNVPSAFTLPAYAITTTTATLSGQVNPNNLATNYHFEYGTTPAFGNSTSIISAGSGASPIPVSAGITGLIPGIPIHCRLVAVNSEGTSNGSDIFFIPGGAVLLTTVPSAITLNSANAGGTISSDGGSAVTVRGVCWSTFENPSIADNHTTNGTGTGVFTSSISGLSASTAYHLRAYATNSAGTFYGNDVPFTTLCGIFSLPFYEGFANASQPPCWTQVDYKGYGQTWQFGKINSFTPNPNLTGNYAFLDSDGYGPGYNQNADLVTPKLDLTEYSAVTLSFKHYFRLADVETGTVLYSIDNGANWIPIQAFTTTTANPATFSQAIPAVAGQSQVKFKWNFTGTYAWCWGIDDVQITGLPINRQLSNITVPAGTTNCYNASQTITLAGSGTSFLVQNGGNVTLIAGQKITVLPGTTVQSGGYLWGYISATGPFCTNPVFSPGNTGNVFEESTSVANMSANDLFRVYPNPTSGIFTLELATSEGKQIADILISDMMGNTVFKESVSEIRNLKLSLSGKPAGVYMIQVVSGNRVETVKVIKQ